VDLVLLRHGIAEQRAASGQDRDRALTAEGTARLRDVVTRARHAGLAPRWIVASPYLRAQQSARIAAEVLEYRDAILSSPALVPDSSPAALWAEARELDESPLLFVSHEPLLSATAAWLTGETRVIIEFRPATMVSLAFEEWSPAPRGLVRSTLHA
jgi:phosphohistidine phosphatase